MYNIRLIEQEDYKRYFSKRPSSGLPTGFSETSESPSIPINTYAWNSVFGALHVNDGSADLKGSFDVDLGGLTIGDIIDINIEVMNISGVKAKIAVDRYLPTFTNEFILNSVKSDEFEILGGRFVVKSTGAFKAIIGVFTGDIGEYYVRNINIKVSRKNNLFYYPSFRMYTFNKISGDFLLADIDNKYGCSITTTNTYIEITHDIGFSASQSPNPSLGVAMANVYGGNDRYIAKTRTETSNFFRVTFHDLQNGGLLVNPNDLPDGIYFNCIHFGYENERYIGV